MEFKKEYKQKEKSLAICIIPARGGSKRIPLKNIRHFAGKPIIWYPIDIAKKSKLFDHVFVSTESELIAKIARDGGAEVPFIRPLELADDETPIYDVLSHAVNWMKNQSIKFKYICCMYATALFIKDIYLRQGFEVLVSGKANRAFTVSTYPGSIFRALRINEQGLLKMIWPENKPDRCQDLPRAYYNAGQFHWYKANYFNNNYCQRDKGAAPIVIPRYLAHDIDTP